MGLGFTWGATAAYAANSDDPTPYTVDERGITLPAGDTFPAHGHVNINSSAGPRGIHFDPNNGHPGGAWIGENFIPWAAFGLSAGDTVTWVQVGHYNEHYGEGGQPPVEFTDNTQSVLPRTPPAVPQAPSPVPQAPSPVPQAPSPVPQAPSPVPQAPPVPHTPPAVPQTPPVTPQAHPQQNDNVATAVEDDELEMLAHTGADTHVRIFISGAFATTLGITLIVFLAARTASAANRYGGCAHINATAPA